MRHAFCVVAGSTPLSAEALSLCRFSSWSLALALWRAAWRDPLHLACPAPAFLLFFCRRRLRWVLLPLVLALSPPLLPLLLTVLHSYAATHSDNVV